MSASGRNIFLVAIRGAAHIVVLSILLSFASIDGALAAERPVLNILSIESDLQSCVSRELEVRIDRVKPVNDLSLAIPDRHLELIMFCESINVQLRDKEGALTTVPTSACASVLSENPGTKFSQMLSTMKKLKTPVTGLTRRLRVIATTGQLGQQCRTIVNQVIPAIFQWLLHSKDTN